MRTGIYFTLYFLVCWAGLHAQTLWHGAKIATEPQLSISGTNLAKGQEDNLYHVEPDTTFSVRVTVELPEGFELQDVQVDNLDNFEMLRRSPSTMQQSINGMWSISKSYEYTLSPKSNQKLPLGPFRAILEKGSVLEKKAMHVQVKTDSIPVRKNQVCYAELHTDTKVSYVGQPFKVMLKIFAKEGKVLEVRVNKPEVEDFEVRELGQHEKRQVINNTFYRVVEHEFLLTPTAPGEHEVPAFSVFYAAEADAPSHNRAHPFDALFAGMMGGGIKEGTARSNRLQLKVLDLPQGQKQSLTAIGNFTELKAELNKTDFVANEPLSLKLSLSGSGNFSQITHPSLRLFKGAKSYPSKSNFIPRRRGGDGQAGVKEFEYIVQVSQSEQHQIPEQKLEFFDVDSGQYKTLKSPAIPFVLEGESQEAEEEKGDLQNLSEPTEQLDQPHFDLQQFMNAPVKTQLPALSLFWFFLLMILPVLGAVFWRLKGTIFNLMGPAYALSSALKGLQSVKHSGKYHKLLTVLLTYFSIRFRVHKAVVTDTWLEDKLKVLGFSTADTAAFVNFFHRCGSLYFSGSEHDKSQEVGLKAVDQAKVWLKKIEAQAREQESK